MGFTASDPPGGVGPGWLLQGPVRSRSSTSPLVFVRLVGSTVAHPFVDLGQLELPEAADFVGRQALSIDPSIDGVLRHAEMLGDVIN